MANGDRLNTKPNPYYAIQPAFTGGEISSDVASRVDLDKYQLSLLQAENAVIRPYGAVHKRTGSIYCGNTKYADRRSMLYKFEFSVELNYLLEIGDYYIRIWKNGTYIGIELSTPFSSSDLSSLRFVQSVDVIYICSGKYPVKKLSRYSETSWTLTDVDWTLIAYGDINSSDTNKITPSGKTGNITLSAVSSTFDSGRVGDSLKLEQYVDGTSAALKVTKTTETYSSTIGVGETWKVITHGTWTGTVTVQRSTDNGVTWKKLRTYTSTNDYNPTESGDVDEYSLMRLDILLTSGTCNADLSAYPYNHTGYVRITAVNSSTSATGVVTKTLGSTDSTADWYWAAWSQTNGYPKCAAFFQDRLCFGGCSKYPQRVWMSRSGDYENFGVEKESGTVTDDSTVTADLLSLKPCSINHMDVGNDLIIFTEGNTSTISGGETVTPSNITPRNQENYGTNDVIPIHVGNRAIYVQRRGSIIRDIGYTYDTDSYIGIDLTLLAKHLIRNREILSAAYAQEPDSMLYFVTDDGQMICLTYVIEQKVYGWSHFVTDGLYESVSAIGSGNNDVIYAVVNRTINGETRRYIERFAIDSTSDNQQDHVIVDSAVIKNFSSATTSITGLDNMNEKTVKAIGDGYLFDDITVHNGSITLPQASKNVVIGLPYTMILEQPNWDAGNTDSGTVQGRFKHVSTAILRLTNSYGGRIGPNSKHMNSIIYDSEKIELGDAALYSGDKKITMAAGGFDTEARVYIKHDDPYPFTVSAIIREVTIGG